MFAQFWRVLISGGLLLAPALAWSGEAAPPAVADPAGTAWVITASALVLFMNIPGLALFYGGLVRAKNVLSVLMQCVAITAVVSVLWLIYGYALAFGDGGAWQGAIGGLEKLWLGGVGKESVVSNLPESVFILFQLTFAIITPALVVGGFAERMKFSATLWFSALWFTLVYLPLCHWVWGGGWLAKLGVMDFAGGIVVHISAGVAALTAALVMGRRKGFPTTLMLPHNMTMTYTGAAMLWVGWYGFNGGSALAANAGAGQAILVTHMAAAGGCLSWMGMEWVRHGKASMLGIVTGMVAGLGTVTPASGFISIGGGLMIGALAGVVCYWALIIVKQKWKIDDSLDVFPVHGVGGMMGTLLTGVLAAPSLGGAGFTLEGMNMLGQVGVQALAVVSAALWTAALSYGILRVVDRLVGLRVTLEEETEGLDLALHDERGYSLDMGSH